MTRDDRRAPDDRPRILMVEDSQTVKAMLVKHLSDSYVLIEARDGEEAWELLCADPTIDVIITDINMPRMTGHQLLVKIRKSGDLRLRELPVIVMTTGDDKIDKNLAFLNGANDFLTKPIDAMELQARVKVHHKLASTIRELERSKQALSEQATTDPLTRLKNRRAFFAQGEQNVALSKRHKTELSVLLLDIDHFKTVNDRFGHQAGDEALVTVAGLLTGLLRGGDMLARIGGEEFAALLPETNRLGAAVLAERIRAVIEKADFRHDGQHIPLTVSIGMASLGAETVDRLEELLNIADRRLYLAKNGGRNRICVNDEGKSRFA
jgi:two-component system, cell cycle response regulator